MANTLETPGDAAQNPRHNPENHPANTSRSGSEPKNAIFIGTKPLMSYVLAVVTQFGGGKKEVMIKARGNSISKAVDVAELVKNKFAPGTAIESIKTATETLKSHDGKEIGVSTITILIKRP